MEQSNDTNRDENSANHQQINDSHHQHHHQQQDMPVSDRQQAGAEHNNNSNGHQHRSSPNRLRESAQHISGHHSPDNEHHQRTGNTIIDAHTHVITETPHNPSAAHEHHLKKEGQGSHSPSNIVDHSTHGSPVHELTQAAVGHSIDDKGGDGLHIYSGYHSGHQQHHQNR